MIREPKQFFAVFVLLLILSKSAARQRRMLPAKPTYPVNPYRSFSSDINACVFSNWPAGVLSGNVACDSPDDVQLCYGKYNGGRALFAVCYNTKTLIAEFTGHELQNGGTVGAANMIDPDDFEDKRWKTDQGLVEKNIPVAVEGVKGVEDDYDPYNQAGKFENYKTDKSQQFLGRGHLSPNGDFRTTNYENSFTYVSTNIAPQWQPFNMGNWAQLEMAVKAYADKKTGRVLYVFTGTGGRAKYQNADIMLKDRVLTPQFYWKAVCDPQIKQSIVFVAENKPGDISDTGVVGCNGKQQTSRLGIILCFGLSGARDAYKNFNFKLPPFGVNCNPGAKGTFLDDILKTKLQ